MLAIIDRLKDLISHGTGQVIGPLTANILIVRLESFHVKLI